MTHLMQYKISIHADYIKLYTFNFKIPVNIFAILKSVSALFSDIINV